MANKKANLRSEPSYKLHVEANGFSDILCEVYLPRKRSGEVEIYLYPNKDIPQFPWKFSLKGETKDFQGQADAIIESETVYLKNESTRYWGIEIKDRVVACRPDDVKITRNINDSPKSNSMVNGFFIITPPEVLQDIRQLIPYPSGQVQSEIIQEFNAIIEPAVKLDFDQQFLYERDKSGGVNSVTELIAKFSVTQETFNKIIDFNEIDDLMLLLSFAYRQRCVSLGWVASHTNKIETFYRQNMAKPCVSADHGFYDMLIERHLWMEFLDIAHKKITLMDLTCKENLRVAINGLLNYKELHFEASYQVLYSGLEALCNLFKLHYREIAKKTNKDIQARAYAMAKYHKINLDDLWPIGKNDQKETLTYIRNQISHCFDREELHKNDLIMAREHLVWIIERLVLSLLKWPVEKSKVSTDFLSSHMACYVDWHKNKKQQA
ncbi:MAG: hypothetical protein KAT56_10780 [Sedimentisphaerales bacterium]|nr:hypothetical protein [Sedimentisphaerales bacterium]